MVTWLTSTTGIFAAIVAVVGLLGGLVVLLSPLNTSWRRRRRNRKSIVITRLDIGELSKSSDSRDLRFQVVNSGSTRCMLQSIRLVVDAHGVSEQPRHTRPEAGVVVHKHRVELAPGKDNYDIRSRAFGPRLPPIALDPGESEAFLVKVVSREHQWYKLRVVADWFDSKDVTTVRPASSDLAYVDFPPRIDVASR